jgi:hypothetical protein
MSGEERGGRVTGEVIYLYAFDVANEIRVAGVAELLSARPVPFTVRTDRAAARAVPLYQPLAVEPPPPKVSLAARPVRLLVRVYEFGVISVAVRVGFEDWTLDDLMPFQQPTLDDGRPLDRLAWEVCAETRRELEAHLVRPGPENEPEAYTAFCLTDLGGEADASRWLADRRRAVAGLLAGTDPARLSEDQVAEGLRLRRSFTTADVVVVDWEAALVVDLDGYAEDVLFVLELANLQLEEFRWIDRALDRYLERAYGELHRPRWPLVGGWAKVLRSLRRLRVELAKLADEVTHVTKFVGDWHLARVYLLARERFHLDQWRASVGERLGGLDQLYTLAQGERYNRRMLVLEFVIVLLFALDLIALFLLKR